MILVWWGDARLAQISSPRFRGALLGIVSMYDTKGATKIDNSHDSADMHKVRNMLHHCICQVDGLSALIFSYWTDLIFVNEVSVAVVVF